MLKDKIYLSSPHLNALNIDDFHSINEVGNNNSITKFENQIEEHLEGDLKVACLSFWNCSNSFSINPFWSRHRR